MFRDILPKNTPKAVLRFGEKYHFHLQGERICQDRNQHEVCIRFFYWAYLRKRYTEHPDGRRIENRIILKWFKKKWIFERRPNSACSGCGSMTRRWPDTGELCSIPTESGNSFGHLGNYTLVKNKSRYLISIFQRKKLSGNKIGYGTLFTETDCTHSIVGHVPSLIQHLNKSKSINHTLWG